MKRRSHEPPSLWDSLPIAGSAAARPAESASLDPAAAALRVLIADDDDLVRDAYQEFLADRSADEAAVEVCFEAQAEAAVAAVEAASREGRPFAIAFLDVRMPPGNSGIWAAERIRALDAAIELVIVTAHSDVDPREIAAQVPPAHKLLYLQKPLHPHVLEHCVSALGAKWRAERALAHSQARLAAAQRIARFAHWEWSPREGRAWWSPELNTIFGFDPDEAGGPIEKLWDRVHPDDETDLALGIHRAVEEGGTRSLEYRLVLPDGSQRFVQHEIAVVASSGGGVRLVGSIQEVSDRKEAEHQIRRLAYYDPVTDIPNRSFLLENLPFVLRQAQRHGRHVALMYIDLDNFKRINDSFGHRVGDEVLVEVARRLTASVRDSDCVVRPERDPSSQLADTVARLGGDEFIVLLTEVARPEDPAHVARRIQEALAQPIVLGGRSDEVVVGGSVGIAVSPVHGEDSETLLANADAAMYHAKHSGKSTWKFYSEDLNSRAEERHRLETDLRHAVEREELVLLYQPKVDLRDGRVIAAEALLRWDHPQRGRLEPESFLAVAEESGLIGRLGEWGMRSACDQLAAWRRAGLSLPRMAVNLSFRQLKDGRLATKLLEILTETGVPPEAIELEFTETALMDDAEQSCELLEEMHRAGLRIVMDDFGTGYSSLAHLKRLPLEGVKIDGCFVAGVASNDDDLAIVTAIIALAHRMGLRVVAEGIETTEQLVRLREHGCDEGQGFRIGEPLAADAFAERFLSGEPLELPDA